MTAWKRLVLVLFIVLGCIGCDQATKSVAQARLPRREVLSFAGDTLRLQYAENRGAFLGFGDALPERTRVFVLTWAVGLLLGGLFAYLLFSSALPPQSLIAWSLVCGGGLSNVVDRVARSGCVVDFLNLGIGPLRTGIFNLADLAITTGVLLLVFGGFAQRRDAPADRA